MMKNIPLYPTIPLLLIFIISVSSCAVKQESGLDGTNISRNALYPRIAGFGPISPRTTKKELDFLARYSLFVCGCDNVPDKLLYLKSKNPNLIILYYITAINSPLKNSAMKPEFWLRDPEGRLVPHAAGYIVNQTLPEVNEISIKKAYNVLNKMPQIDGIFIDDFNPGIGHLNNGQFDADSDGRKDDREKFDNAWIEGLLRIARGIKAIRQGVIVIGNGGGPLKFGYDVLNGVELENQMRRIENSPPDIADNLLNAYQKWGHDSTIQPRVIVVTDGAGKIRDRKEWANALPQRKEQLIKEAGRDTRLMRFNLGFTLLGEGYAAFNYGEVSFDQRWWYPEWDMKIGRALEPARRLNGYWMRRFEYATVYVNPYSEPVQVKDNEKGFLLPSFDGKIILK